MSHSIPSLGPYALIVQEIFSTFDSKYKTLLGPEGVPITVTQNGCIIFDFGSSQKYNGGAISEIFEGSGEVPELELAQREHRKQISYLRFKYMNSAMLILLSEAAIESNKSFMIPQPYAPDNYAHVVDLNGSLTIQRTSQSTLSSTQPKHILTFDTVKKFANTFVAISDALGDYCMDVCSLIYTATFNYSKHDFSSSLLIGWAAAEKVIIQLHSKHIGSPSKWRMDKNIQDLKEANILNENLLSLIEKAKQARNDFAHNLHSSSNETASKAILSAARLISISIGRELRPLLTTTHHI